MAAPGAHSAHSEPPRRFDLTISKWRVAGGLKTIRVTQGETVELNWYSDEPAVLHLHGYDIEIVVASTAPAKMRFHAHAAGRYPIVPTALARTPRRIARAGKRRCCTLKYIRGDG